MSKPIDRPTTTVLLRTIDGSAQIHGNFYAQAKDGSEPIFSNYLFVSQMLHFIFSTAFLILSLLVITDVVELNHYAVLISGVVVWFSLLCIFYVSTWSWYQKPAFSHHHKQEIFVGFTIWTIAHIIYFVALGVWLLTKDDSECCDFDDAQPSSDPNSREYIQLIVIYLIIYTTEIVCSYTLLRSLIAHYHPEAYLNIKSLYNYYKET